MSLGVRSSHVVFGGSQKVSLQKESDSHERPDREASSCTRDMVTAADSLTGLEGVDVSKSQMAA